MSSALDPSSLFRAAHSLTESDSADGAGQQRAVAESRALLAQRWPAWCAERGVDDQIQPVTGDPVIYQVGLDLEHTQWVALIRFDASSAGRRWHGLVRGPVDDVVFTVLDTPPGTPTTRGIDKARAGRPRHRWRRQTG